MEFSKTRSFLFFLLFLSVILLLAASLDLLNTYFPNSLFRVKCEEGYTQLTLLGNTFRVYNTKFNEFILQIQSWITYSSNSFPNFISDFFHAIGQFFHECLSIIF